MSIHLCLIFILCVCSGIDCGFYRYADVLYDIISRKDYDPHMRPHPEGPPVNISVSIFVTSIHSLSEVSMDYGTTLFMSVYWNDPRFKFNGTEAIALPTGSDLLGKVWTPDLYLVNVKEGMLHQVTVTNKHIRVYPSGKILYDLRFSVVLICNLYLHHFPMDIQTCGIEVESFGYTVGDVRLLWSNEYPASFPDDLVMPEFSLSSPEVSRSVHSYPHVGSFDVLFCKFTLHRQLIYYILEHYIPSSLMVIVSWVSFWLDVEATPARASLGITTALTLATLSSSARAHMAKVSYTKALDVWMLVCSLFVFAALVEFAIASYLFKKTRADRVSIFNKENDIVSENGKSWIELKQRKEREPLRKPNAEAIRPPDGHRALVHVKKLKNLNYREMSKAIDKYSRFLFPITFGIFNSIYWSYYLHDYYS
ncbi:glycine receptor subunit alpha-4-like [Ptychodera flava]|uniref:glycine receptor subunit alpha-4-like n=1 Tax=Ptychodera flava TaxID=63121 RepID=UPI00396AAC28